MTQFCEASTKPLNTGWYMNIKFEDITGHMPLIKNLIVP